VVVVVAGMVPLAALLQLLVMEHPVLAAMVVVVVLVMAVLVAMSIGLVAVVVAVVDITAAQAEKKLEPAAQAEQIFIRVKLLPVAGQLN
jgi:hypothetical protein